MGDNADRINEDGAALDAIGDDGPEQCSLCCGSGGAWLNVDDDCPRRHGTGVDPGTVV